MGSSRTYLAACSPMLGPCRSSRTLFPLPDGRVEFLAACCTIPSGRAKLLGRLFLYLNGHADFLGHLFRRVSWALFPNWWPYRINWSPVLPYLTAVSSFLMTILSPLWTLVRRWKRRVRLAGPRTAPRFVPDLARPRTTSGSSFDTGPSASCRAV
jgi:hypothetical protein